MQPTINIRKPVDALGESDLATFPVWEYISDEDSAEEEDETWMRPVDTSVIPAGSYSLTVAASFKTASGQIFAGFVVVSTDEEVEIHGGALFHGNEHLFVPAPGFWNAADDYERLFSALHLAEKDVLPLGFKLAVVVEGELAPRQGECSL